MKPFKQFLLEYFTNPLIWFKDYINLDSNQKAIDLAYNVYSSMLDEYFDDIDEEYKDFEDMSEEELYEYGTWLLDHRKLTDYVGHENLPSWWYFSNATIVKNSWLIHATNNVDDIIKEGFLYGLEDYCRIGLTNYYTTAAKKREHNSDFYSFGFTIPDFKHYWKPGHYGGQLIMFMDSGVRCFHNEDEEYQTIFLSKEAKNFIPIYSDGDSFWVNNKKQE